MSTFDDRTKTFENKFAHDRDLEFKIAARRNRMLGRWAAEKLHFDEQKTEDYAMELVDVDIEKPGYDDVIEKVLADFTKAGVNVNREEVVEQIANFHNIAKEQILSEKK